MKKILIVGGIVILALVIFTGLSAAGYAIARAQNAPVPTPTLAPPDAPESETDPVPSTGEESDLRQNFPASPWMGGPMMNRQGVDCHKTGECAGMMQGIFNPYQSYMIKALADELGLTTDELQAKLDDGQSPYEIAKGKGLSDDQIRELIEKAHDEALKQAVADGVITQEQADLMEKRIESIWETGDTMMGWWKGSFRGQIQAFNFDGLLQEYKIQVLAEALGMTTEELQNRLNAGDTAWQVAQEKGMTAEQFRIKMIESAKKTIEQALADGKITQEQADWLLSRVDTFIDRGFGNWVDRMQMPRGRWFRHP